MTRLQGLPPVIDALSCGGAVGGINLQTATVVELQAALKAGTLSSERLVRQSLARIAASSFSIHSLSVSTCSVSSRTNSFATLRMFSSRVVLAIA